MTTKKGFGVLLSFSISFILYSFFTTTYAQSSANSLLWEISGNGLKKPSYLYGTIHIKDQKVFNLSDSVLIKLNECPVTAFELDLDSARQAALKSALEVNNIKSSGNTDSSDTKEKYFTDEEEKIIKKGLSELTGVSEEKISLSNPSMIFFLINEYKYQKGNMPEILDQRLFNFAKSKGKKLIGIETFEEQMKAFSSLDNSGENNSKDSSSSNEDSELKRAILNELKDLAKGDSALQEMTDAYVAQDLRKIRNLLNASEENYPEFFHNIFEVRNVRMADRIAGLVQSEPTFIAIGVGHLYGADEVIALLEKKGFTLRPVRASYASGLTNEFINFKVKNSLKKITSTEGAFEAEFPGDPIFNLKKMPLPSGTTDSMSIFIWAALDNTGYSSFIAKYNDLVAGRFITNDSAYFNIILTNAIANSNGTLEYCTHRKFSNFPAIEYKINVMNNITLKVIEFLRGNRDYALITSQYKFDSLQTESFFNSFKLKDFAPVQWSAFSDPNGSFIVDLPNTAVKTERDTSISRIIHNRSVLSAMDPNSGQSYIIEKGTFSDYYHTENDSTLFSEPINNLISKNDSVLSNINFNYQGRKAREVIIRSATSYNCKRVRFILDGNNMYGLYTFAPEQWLNSERISHFYDSFKFTGELKDSKELFTDKVDRLFKDLQSEDSTICKSASAYLPIYKFEKKHLGQIYSVLKTPFRDDTAKASIRSKLFNLLGKLNDSTTVNFISELYPQLSDNSQLKIPALKTLSTIGTDESVNKFQELLLSHAPSGDNAGEIFYPFYTTPKKIDPLFPQILKLLNREEYKEPVYSLINERIDSLPRLKNDLANLSETIKKDLKEFAAKHDSLKSNVQKENDQEESDQQESDDSSSITAYDNVLDLILSCIHCTPKDPETEKTITALASDTSSYLCLHAVTALIKMGSKCPAGLIEILAEDISTRNELYEELLKVSKDNLFPAKYKTKEMMAESDLYTFLRDDYSAPDQLVLLGSKETESSGEKGIFYLYKFNFSNDPDNWYTGISGPQPSGKKKAVAHGKLTNSKYKVFQNDAEEQWKELLSNKK